ncbi:MAG: hypothetical protein ACRDRZ_09500 [Pseudonocardiaceae bacterium]
MTIAGSGGAGEGALLPWPDEWFPPVRPRHIVLVAGMSLVALAILAAGILALVDDNTGAAVVLILMSPILVLLTAWGFLALLRGRHRDPSVVDSGYVSEVGKPATVIPYSLPVFACYVLLVFAVLLFFGFFAVALSAVGARDGFGDPAVLVPLAISGVASISCLYFLFTVIRGRLGRGSLALMPDGVYHRGWMTRSFVGWDEVLSVRAYEVLHGPIIRIGSVGNDHSSVAPTSSGPVREIEVRGRLLSVDPALTYHALRYYHEHPEARAELAGDAAVRRLRSGALPVSQRPT